MTDTVVRGLQLRIAIDGSKSWSLRYRIGRRMRRLTLGDAAVLPLATARTRAKDALRHVSNGKDPADAKQERRTLPTVEDFAAIYIEKHAKPKLKRWRGVQSRLDHDVLPRWRHMLMKDITRRDVRLLIDEIAARPAPISANRVRALLSKFFNVAIEHDVVETNPVIGTPRPGDEQRRERVLTHDEIRQFWTACEQLAPEMAGAWRLRLLTAQRASEVFGMTWREVDLGAGWWTIPGDRSKNRMSHRVPLSSSVLTIVKDVKDRRELSADTKAKKSPYVFYGARKTRDRHDAAETFRLKDFTGHDLRRTAASLMTGSGTSRFIVSKILNHAEPGVTAVYDRHGCDVEKRIALDAWARTLEAILDDTKANVVPFARG